MTGGNHIVWLNPGGMNVKKAFTLSRDRRQSHRVVESERDGYEESIDFVT